MRVSSRNANKCSGLHEIIFYFHIIFIIVISSFYRHYFKRINKSSGHGAILIIIKLWRFESLVVRKRTAQRDAACNAPQLLLPH